MKQKKILKALLHANKEYTTVLELDCNKMSVADFDAVLDKKAMHSGFCTFFRISHGVKQKDMIIAELLKDLVYRFGFPNDGLWYDTLNTLFYGASIQNIKQQALQPRLDHLNRTITRLQEELNTATV